jgi:MFS family permease
VSTGAIARAGEQTKVVGLVGLGHFYSHFSVLILPPLFPFMKGEFDVSYVALGGLASAYNIATGASQVPFGFVVDRFGARTALLGGIAAIGGCFALIGFADAYWQIMALLLLAGLANGVFHPADYSILAARISEGFLGRAMSLHSFTGYIGFAVAPMGMLALYGWAGWRGAASAAGILGVAIACVMLLYGGSLDDRAARASHAAPAKSASATGFALMRSAPMVMMFVFFAFTSAVTSGFSSFSVVAIGELYRVRETVAGYGLTAFLSAVAIGVLVGGVLADHTRRHNLVAGIAVAAVAVLFAIVGVGTVPVAVALSAIALAGFGYGVSSPSRDLIVRAAAPPGAVGVAFGFTSTGLGVGGAIGPVLCGWLMDAARPDLSFLLLAGLSLAAVVTVWATRPRAGG